MLIVKWPTWHLEGICCKWLKKVPCPYTLHLAIFQVCKSYSIKCLHDVRVLTKKAGSQRDLTEAGQQQRQQLRQQQQQQQQWVELRIASHHEVAEHRGCYLMQDYEQLMFFMSLITQILR